MTVLIIWLLVPLFYQPTTCSLRPPTSHYNFSYQIKTQLILKLFKNNKSATLTCKLTMELKMMFPSEKSSIDFPDDWI